jgi:anti-sigma factor RsiW
MRRPIRDIDLMQLADGELDAAERAELEAALAADPVVAQRAEVTAGGIEEVGEVVRGEAELAADEAEPRLSGMWAEIEKRMALDAAPAPKKTISPGLWGRVSKWFDTYRGHVLTGALSAGAVATIALVLRPTTPPKKETAEIPAPQPEIVNVAAPVEVESAEAPNGTSTVFTYQTDDGEETTVIWVTPDDTTEDL